MFKQWLSHPALIYAVSTALVIAGFVLAYQFVEPAPPSRIVMGTGNEDGAYFYHANQYKRLLAKSGITLDVRPTSGSMENLERLGSDEPDRVDLAFVQGGVRRVDAQTNLLSIGSMYYEPVWVFYRQTGALRYLAELEGKRLAVGAISSGTRPVALRDHRQYSVILGVFSAGGSGAPVTVAQVFCGREDGTQPERFFVVADGDLSIGADFDALSGSSLADLRSSLKARGAQVEESFPPYAKALLIRLGIPSEQALDLFHQTVSMKAVDDLN
ncbi:MAG: hypothetical protein KDK91_28735, partial [Gammaproteobacteria bacterium]|nr:hypothetical protein [Gammaproteobacteria bacterium]